MSVIYVAQAKSLSEWGSDVGLSKHIFHVGVAPDAAAAVSELNHTEHGGASDWKLLKSADAGELDRDAALERLRKREKQIDPTYYPRIRGATDLFRVVQRNVENHLVVKQALDSLEIKVPKVKVADFAAYLIKNALG